MINKRGATEQDGRVGKTEKIILPISSPHHAQNRCREGEEAADTNQVYWIFIAMLASWSVTLGSTLNWLSHLLHLFKEMIMRLGFRYLGKPKMKV